MLKQEPTSRGVGILGLQAGEEVKKPANAFTVKPDISAWMRKANKSATQSIIEASEAKKKNRVPFVLGPRRYGQIKDWN